MELDKEALAILKAEFEQQRKILLEKRRIERAKTLSVVTKKLP